MFTKTTIAPALILAAAAGSFAFVPNTANAQEQYELRAMNSNKCAHVEAASQVNGGRISQWECNANQMGRQDNTRRDFFKWRINVRGEWFMLQAVHSNKCAQVDQASHANDAHITQWDCVNKDNVYWKKAPAGSGFYYIVNKASGKCMHVHGGGNQNGTLITQWECVNQPNVKWRIPGATPLSNPALNPVQ
jgi:Ricin-type beta-trefoil lectin domain-like